MARPTSKADLLAAATEGFTKLSNFVDNLPVSALTAAFVFEDRDRSVRDVLWHLHRWHRMLIEWHRIGCLEGGVPAVPGEGYTWRTLPDLNQRIWVSAQTVAHQDARSALETSHAEVIGLIEKHTNEEIFSRGAYAWTKSTTLGAYFVGGTSSHYDWAMKKLRRHQRTFSG